MAMTVTEIGVVVVAELRAAGYLESTIGQYAKTIKALSEYAGLGGVYSPELGAEFALRTISPRTGRFSPQRRLDYRRLTGVFDSYVRTGRVDLSVRGRGGGGPRPACAALAALDAGWEADMAGRGLGDAEAALGVRAWAAGGVSARNAAITLLAVTTGLRACDIIALRLADVDWRGQAIGIVQRKTGNPLTLPLPALVMGKLAGYVLGERPATADDHVFVRVVAPHVRLAGHASVHRVISATFAAAGVADAKAGTRFLRHSAATRLLRAAVPLPAISAVLGHAAEDSASVYMSADRERLLQCVLPVPAGARQ